MKKLIILFALFTHVAAAQNVPNYVPSNGLIGWWPLNGNANDLSGNGNNGVVNGATSTTDRKNSSNKAYSFGANNKISLGNTINSFVGDFTVSLWFNATSITSLSDNSNFLISKYRHFATNQSSFFIGLSNGKIYVAGNGSNTMQHPFNQTLTWNHLAVTKAGGQAKLYVNGIKIDSTILSFNAAPNNSDLVVGGVDNQSNFASQMQFYGKIDDIGIWSRRLTPIEIQNLFISCSDSLSQNPSSTNATVGTNATFTALSSASGATYQWQAKNGSSFVNVSNAGQFSGATSSTLTVNGVSSANNALEVRCVVNHGNCIDTSDVAVLSSCFALTAQPIDQYVVAGSSANFTAATNDPACTYQWQTNAGFGFQNLSNAGQFSGVTSATLNISGVSLTNNNQLFRCLVFAGTCLDTTATAKIVLSGVGVPENALMRVSVSPTPTRGLVNLGVALEGAYTLISIDGRTVQTGALRQTLDFSNQPAGVYSLRLETAAGNRVVKVVKE